MLNLVCLVKYVCFGRFGLGRLVWRFGLVGLACYEVDIKMRMISKYENTLKMKATSKLKVTKKIEDHLKYEDILKK